MTMPWFRHDLASRDDDKCFEIIDIHGIGGYGFWWAILEELYKAEDTGFQIEVTPVWIKRLAKDLNIIDSRAITRYFDTFADLGLINKQMWQEHIIYSDGVMKRGDAYMKEKARKAKNKQDERDRAKQVKLNVTSDNTNVTSDKSVTNEMSFNVVRPDPDPETETNTNIENTNMFTVVNESVKSDFFEADFQEISGSENLEIPRPLTQIINQEPVPVLALVKSQPKNGFTPEQFDEFWEVAQKKVGKDTARKAFLKIKNVDYALLLDAWKSQHLYHLNKNGCIDFLPQPTTWLNQQRWQDELEISFQGKSPANVKSAVNINQRRKLLEEKFGKC
jgi:hypothetical protein